jgi:hypothetical protein
LAEGLAGGTLFLLREHEGDGPGLFGEFLTELAEEGLLDALRHQVIDRDQRQGEDHQKAQNELAKDARGQDSLCHCGRGRFVNFE